MRIHPPRPSVRRLSALVGLLVCLAVAGCGGRGGAGATPSQPAQAQPTATLPLSPRRVTFSGASGWVKAGISVKPQEHLIVGCRDANTSVSAKAATAAAAGGPKLAGKSAPVPGVYRGGVIGRIGASGTPFYIGALFDHSLIAATGSGPLELALNDERPVDTALHVTCATRVSQTARAPLQSTFTGDAVTTIYDPGHQGFAGPFAQHITLKLLFDGARNLVQLRDFPTMTVGPISTSAGKDMITISPVDVYGAFGPYGPSSPYIAGAVLHLPLTLQFKNSIGLAGTCIAPFTFTTGSITSPGGHLHGTGRPLRNGAITLMGASKFSCNALYNPTGGHDVLMRISGRIGPRP